MLVFFFLSFFLSRRRRTSCPFGALLLSETGHTHKYLTQFRHEILKYNLYILNVCVIQKSSCDSVCSLFVVLFCDTLLHIALVLLLLFLYYLFFQRSAQTDKFVYTSALVLCGFFYFIFFYCMCLCFPSFVSRFTSDERLAANVRTCNNIRGCDMS